MTFEAPDPLQSVANTSFQSTIDSDTKNNTQKQCTQLQSYLEFEPYYYLYFMCPIAIIGIILNIISLRVFHAKSFNTTVTFKYLRIIARTDLCICTIVLFYCISMYTPAFNYYDLYIRHFYLAYIYIPFANLIINLSMFFNLLVSIERLVSVGWPTKKYTFFKPSRYILSCIIVFVIAVLFNFHLFFEYEIQFCGGFSPREFVFEKWFNNFNIFKEMITRVMPIIMLIIANIMLIFIVKNSRNRMKLKSSKAFQKTQPNPEETKCCACLRNLFTKQSEKPSTSTRDERSLIMKTHANKRNRQDNQLTLMTICVALLYIACSVPMCLIILLPSLVWKTNVTGTNEYKHFAAICNSLELIQCLVRFFIYYFFTTQFRVELKKACSLLCPAASANQRNNIQEDVPLNAIKNKEIVDQAINV